MVKPFREELTQIGFVELLTADDVERAMRDAHTGATLVVVNSVDGCAAGIARPGVRIALEGDKRLDRLRPSSGFSRAVTMASLTPVWDRSETWHRAP
ncbi:BrxA/BrxB family bacilliredoxin [Streptomyces avidinii]|uniref:BrxA/BrxB family bacilliredoxin n=1 Tax=Streptomyces TaxID=1883 RepID=UPI0026667A3C|nr:BrxA/BrxB family bacilliredoxin [Streptomyces sp. ADI95-16]